MSDDSWTDVDPWEDLAYYAWTIIANAHGGDWSQASPEWQSAAETWRNNYHKLLS